VGQLGTSQVVSHRPNSHSQHFISSRRQVRAPVAQVALNPPLPPICMPPIANIYRLAFIRTGPSRAFSTPSVQSDYLARCDLAALDVENEKGIYLLLQ
jgi:hypothetical protein